MDDAITPELRDTLLAAERRVWDALVRGDADADRAALSAGFLGVYPTGFSDKAGHVAQLEGGPGVADFRLSDVHVMALGPDFGLLAYRADYRRVGRGAEEAMLVSSVWQRRPKGWINVFSQDTPLTGEAVP